MGKDHYSIGEVVGGLLSMFWAAFVIATIGLIAWKLIGWAWS